MLADLPGLIEGAHMGRGLGRQFLRHLRRVRVVLYVLDTTSDTADAAAAAAAAAAADADADAERERAGRRVSFEAEAGAEGGETNGTSWPGAVEQYEALRRELYLYNPEYLARPHIVALNKLDLPLQRGGPAAFDEARARIGRAVAASAAAATEQTAPPVAIVPLSGLRGKGIKILKEAISRALVRADEAGAEGTDAPSGASSAET